VEGNTGFRRAIRSFVVRAGRMTEAQRRAMQELWPRFGVEYSDQPLDLDALFGRVAPRVVEVGFGNGDNLAALAAAHPDRDYLGIEVHPPGVGHLLHLVGSRGLTNVRVVSHDAVEVLERQLAPASIDELLVLFPDPWHKKRHHKRRLVQKPFLDLAARVVRPGGRLYLATDWEPYAQQMLELLRVHPAFENLSPDGGFVDRDSERAPTRFERRGERLGHVVHDLAFRRRSG
jgi:tRNA (guanine-N7-)-methyltransferase